MTLRTNAWALLVVATAAGAVACSGIKHSALLPEGLSDGGLPPVDKEAGIAADGAAETFQGATPAVYVAKVKNVLVGLPPTDDETKSVSANPARLGALVDGWMQLPQYTQKMIRFFELAFQQTQISSVDFADQTYPRQIDINNTTTPLLVQNAQESFARTMIELDSEGRPLTEAMSTKRLMMTTALKELYALLDAWEVDDNGKVTDRFRAANPALQITAEAAQGPIDIAQTLDPKSPSFMHWYDPDVATADMQIAGCLEDPIVFPASAMTLHFLLLGGLDGHKTPTGVSCPQIGGTAKAAQLAATDFTDWKVVTLRQPGAGEATTRFYDLPSLRTATELVLSIPRVGFFSTPAFLANWPTNVSNQMRVTMNQALIVATGSSVDGTDPTLPQGTPGLDMAHNTQGACLTCHKVLDPTRSIFSATWSWNYHGQLDTTWAAQPGIFAFRNVVAPVATLQDFGNVLAAHPLVASGWVQKLCYYVNSSPCADTDPEFVRIVDLFTSSGYAWSTLVKSLVTSSLTTNAAETATSHASGEVIAVSRRDHLCAALNARLGFIDVCGLDALGKKAMTTTIPEIVSGLPSDAYGRGSVEPVLPNSPTLFFRAGTENICEAIAAQVIDAPAATAAAGVKQWSSAQPDTAISDFVGIVMAVTPSDPRSLALQALLKSHFAAALQTAGITAKQALQSTFVAACLSPSAVSIGL